MLIESHFAYRSRVTLGQKDLCLVEKFRKRFRIYRIKIEMSDFRLANGLIDPY